ncbi:MAG: fructose-6-phosphate aldolase [Clostridia bacterium]|nr:fructose-6-phosphate aldolase [Deltaproteobacteria bacterium]
MKIFIDTAEIKEIREAAAMGIIDGVTTNPSLIAKSGRDFREAVAEICDAVDGPVSAEVVEMDADKMLAQARIVAKIHKNIIVKVPLTPAGIKTVSTLAPEGIKFNVTLCFSAAQAILAAKAGATYISPFVGRVDDIGEEGITLIQNIVDIYDNYGFETQVLAASIRSPLHVVQSALAGAHVATIPFKVIEQMFKHPLTEQGLKTFTGDYEKTKAMYEKLK